MGDFLYSMMERVNESTGYVTQVAEHSITFNGLNSWDTWHMAPKSRPFVVAPSVKEEYIDVPGADGALDYTEALTGKPRYARRTGTWEFIVENGHSNWYDLYSNILTKLHGKYFDNIVLEDEPEYKWKGRLSVQGQFGNRDYSSITISYNLDPYKYPIGSTAITNWKWADLFGNTIYYGSFSCNGSKCHTILNDSDSAQTCVINLSNQLQVYKINSTADLFDMYKNNFEGYEGQWLATGDNDYELALGENILVFRGNALVKISYERGKTL